MCQINEHFLTLMTLWFQHIDLFQNEVIPLLQVTLQLMTRMLTRGKIVISDYLKFIKG